MQIITILNIPLVVLAVNMGKKNKRYYAILSGRKTGIFDKWFGLNGAKSQIEGFPNAKYKGFGSHEEAKKWLYNPDIKEEGLASSDHHSTSDLKKVIIYTDGGCLRNPGRFGNEGGRGRSQRP